MTAEPDIGLSPLSAAAIAAHLSPLAELLHACVLDGASIGYILPFSVAEAEGFWRDKVLPAVNAGSRLVLVAREGTRIAGTVQLDWDTPPNQPHRAEVRKLMIHPDYRRRGIGRALMTELEARARSMDRRLLTLDTRTGSAAEPLYLALGYSISGTIPGFCLDPFEPRYDSTTIMYKAL
jgi:ribosomal protein S18 acetylase RimI-like enzyme